MTQMILERSFAPPISRQDVVGLARDSGWCLETYHVNWLGSVLGIDGSALVCRFEARDAESVRLALRQARADMSRLWIGTVHEAPEAPEPNVMVERNFESPVELADVQAREDASQWCLDAHNVRFARTYFSQDRRRMLCLYSAPDAEAVRAAQHKAGMPFDRVWAFEAVGMSDLVV
jgi:hypothetical protein